MDENNSSSTSKIGKQFWISTPATTKNLGTPKTEAERAKEHFNISDETWDNMTPEERQSKIDDLPERGEGQKTEDISKIKIISKAEDGFIIGGYANVYMLDEDGEVVPDFDNETITLDALDEGIKSMMANPSRRNHMYYHTNIQLGEIIEEHIDSEGVTWKTHVVYEPNEQYPQRGLFIICKLFPECPLYSEMRNLMNKGEMLAFSVGGLPLAQEHKCDEEKCWNEITKFYLAEVSSCSKGVNAESKAFIMKHNLDKDTQIYYSSVVNNSNGYIGETEKTQLDEGSITLTDSDMQISPETEDDDIFTSKQEEENTLNETEKVIEETECEEIEEETETVEKEISTEEVEEEVVEKTSDEPIRGDYGSFEDFAKAVNDYNEELKSKTPITEKKLDEKLESFKEDILKSIKELTSEETIGEVVKKSVAVKKAEPVTIDYDRKKAFLGVK